MKHFKNPFVRLLGPNVRLLLVPIAIIGIDVTLFAYLASTGYSRITKQLSEYRSAQGSEKVLSDKLEILRQVEAEISTGAESTVIALPNKNPGIFSISQLRLLSSENGFVIENLELANELRDQDVDKMDLKMDLVGQDLPSVVNFLTNIQALAPIMTISEVNIEVEKEGGWLTKMQVSIYWSSLPTTLPKIDERTQGLTQQEVQILTKVSNLKPPLFSVLEPSLPRSRSQPFN